jgi:hypothetical protein
VFGFEDLEFTKLLVVYLPTHRAMSKFSVDKKLDEGLALVQARVASLAVTKKSAQEATPEVDVLEDPSEDAETNNLLDFAHASAYSLLPPLPVSIASSFRAWNVSFLKP